MPAANTAAIGMRYLWPHALVILPSAITVTAAASPTTTANSTPPTKTAARTTRVAPADAILRPDGVCIRSGRVSSGTGSPQVKVPTATLDPVYKYMAHWGFHIKC